MTKLVENSNRIIMAILIKKLSTFGLNFQDFFYEYLFIFNIFYLFLKMAIVNAASRI